MAGDVSLVVSALWHGIFRLTGDWGGARRAGSFIVARKRSFNFSALRAREVSPFGEVLDACAACGFEMADGGDFNFICPLGTEFFA